MVAGNGSVTYYAKYKINEDYFDTLSKIDWQNTQKNCVLDKLNVGAQDIYIFINKHNTLDNLTKISVDALNATPFSCKQLVVYDENGKPIEDINPNANIFEPNEKTKSSRKLVVKITCQSPGDCRITVE